MSRMLRSLCSVALGLSVAVSVPTYSLAEDAGGYSPLTSGMGAVREVESGPFAEWGFPTPPGAENYQVNEATDAELNPEGLTDWTPTANPNGEVVPGAMRSDYERIPEGIDKGEADQAEVKEARIAAEPQRAFRAAPGCSVYWPSWFEVCGAIKELYDKIGGPTSFLSLPRSGELTNPDGVGKRTEFLNGFIYWHPDTGAHTVSLPASKVWARHGWEQGFLGYPTTSDIAQGNGWYKQHFQGGYVYTHNALPPVQASIQGAIYDKWQSLGAQNSSLGFPISDELPTPDGVGRYNFFEGGAIYWTPQHGAYAVEGSILDQWADSGYETGRFGYPIGDATADGEWRVRQNFEHGELSGFIPLLTRISESFFMDESEIQNMVDILVEDFELHGIDGMTGFEELLEQSLESLQINAQNYLEAVADSNFRGANDVAPLVVTRNENASEGCDLVAPGNASTKRGDVFYSVATTTIKDKVHANHGHNGIFVKEGVKADDIVTIEAVSPEKGVQRLKGSDRAGVCKPRLLRVDTDDATRSAAASFAESKEGKGYNSNFWSTRIGPLDRESYNCSQLVWAAYKRASGGGLDIGEWIAYEPYKPAVFPWDIYRSHNTYEY